MLIKDMERFVELQQKVHGLGNSNELEPDEQDEYNRLYRQYMHETADLEDQNGSSLSGALEKYYRRNGRPKYFKCTLNHAEGPSISSVDHGLLAQFMRDSKKYRLCLIDGVPAVWNGQHYECGLQAVSKAAASICDAGCDYTYTDKQAKVEITEHISYSWTTKLETEFMHYVRYILDLPVRMQAPPNLIQFVNGVLDVEKYRAGDIEGSFNPEPDPDVAIVNIIPHPWNPDCPRLEIVDKFLDDMSLQRDNVRKSLEELAGHCLYRDKTELQNFGLMQGEAGNGKSTFCDTLEYALGSENVSHVPLSALSKSFSGAQAMVGKLANIDPDAAGGFTKPEAVSEVKKLSAGDEVHVDIKHHDPLSFRSYATLIVASNKDLTVSSSDAGKAVLQRLVFIPCDADLRGSPSRDRKILKKLTTPEAAQYFLKLAVDGLCRLLDHEAQFSMAGEADELREMFKRNNDSIYAWLCDTAYTAIRFTTWNPDGYENAKRDDINGHMLVDMETGATWDCSLNPYYEYAEWCRSTGRVGEGKGIKFSNRIKKEFHLTRASNPVPTKGNGTEYTRLSNGHLGKVQATSYRPYISTNETVLHEYKALSELTDEDRAKLAALQMEGNGSK